MQWHQLGHMQTICISLQTDNHTNTLSMFTGQMLFLTPNQQCQSTEGTQIKDKIKDNNIYSIWQHSSNQRTTVH